ncbi:DUF4446 family protein [Hominiventricola filiformis]|uniref:DUF4446 family protein n=1 Tax=Hominiventricola filiformis TaxID=2885352 RepID=A0AAE3DB31_9FIRM|nr:DUF4446 family protein [Hominiventricola filiformis]MCC2127578.1 DUF4446 family protein [Hominiventricola filiformis]
MNSMISIFLTSNGIDPFYVKAGIVALILILFLVLLIMQIRLMGKFKKLYRTYDRFMRGKDMESMEETVLAQFERIEALEKSNEEKDRQIESIFENLQHVYQKTGLVKYDAFREMSGKLSYAVALLDKEDNGILVNSMYSREGCYSYVKTISGGKCSIEMSEEEQKALKIAVNKEKFE